MKNLPERIYLNLGDGVPENVDFRDLEEVTWSEEKVNDTDVEYVRKSQWISVDERLPNEDKEVLCRMKSNGAVVSGFIFKNEKGIPQVATSPDFHFEDYGGYEPTHWMPIPSLSDTNTEKE